MFWNLFKRKQPIMQQPVTPDQPELKPDNLETDVSSVSSHTFSIGDKEIFLLHYLHHRKLEWKIDPPVKELFSDYEETISNLKQYGYLKDDDHSYFLEEMNVSDLKKILRDLSLPLSGKKAELIEKIINHTTPEERALICPDLYYVLTPKALDLDNDYIKQRRQQNNGLKELVFNEIASGNYEQASLVKAKTYSGCVIAPGIGIDWSDTERIKEFSLNEQNRLREYDFSDLNNSPEFTECLFQTLF